MRHLRFAMHATLVAAVLTIGGSAAALAGNPSGTGQPNASCEDSTLQPNGFGSGGFANADLHYAGNGAPSLNANSDHAVSQYDVACYQISLHH
jgi:hypothetical protein